MLMQSPASWMKILPVEPSKLTFKELRNFKDFHKLLTAELAGPAGWRYYMQSFRFLQFFGIACIVEDRYPALTKCWHELEKTFMADTIFDDGIFIPSWIFFDLPLNFEGRTLLDEFELFLKEGTNFSRFEIFIGEMRKSRLGLYQEIMSTQKITKFRELISGQVLSTIRSVQEYKKGEIFLTRVVECHGDFFQFGDPKCWPSDYRNQIEGMVMSKLFYFNGETITDQYKQFMKLAGPYWFSCVCTNHSVDILNPDHHLSYQLRS